MNPVCVFCLIPSTHWLMLPVSSSVSDSIILQCYNKQELHSKLQKLINTSLAELGDVAVVLFCTLLPQHNHCSMKVVS